MVEVNHLYKAFGDKQIFADFNYLFENSSVITGASGCGKTTLLRMIAGLEKPDDGIIDGVGSVSFCFQEPRLFPWLTAMQNVALVSDSAKAEAVLQDLGLGDSLHAYPDTLSGGMQKRVALARALVYDADLYLLDEPFSGLDEKTATVAAEVILRHLHDKTLILVTHNTKIADKFSSVMQL